MVFRSVVIDLQFLYCELVSCYAISNPPAPGRGAGHPAFMVKEAAAVPARANINANVIAVMIGSSGFMAVNGRCKVEKNVDCFIRSGATP
ncbi:MAG: hypothetical protein NT040_02280 [Bacteroidetes bacterium]|nr:hypothetical protein [Bacteroidota bacterium]